MIAKSPKARNNILVMRVITAFEEKRAIAAKWTHDWFTMNEFGLDVIKNKQMIRS